MDEKLKNELRVYHILNALAFAVSYLALAISKVLTLYKFNVVMCFVLGVISFVISPYFTILFNKCKKVLAIISGLVGPSAVVVANVIDLSKFNRKFNICLIVGIVILICLVFIRIFEIKKAKRKVRKKKEFLKSFQVLTTAFCIFAIIVSIPTGLATNKLLSKRTVNDSEVISSTVEATNNADTKDNSLIKAHIKKLTPIIDGTYKELSLEERLDIFQIIINVECTYFGSSVAVPIKIKPIPVAHGITYAYFTNEDETIYLNELVFNDLEVEDALYTVLHESYHIYQNEQKKLYESVPDELKNLSTLSGAKECKEGLDGYISGAVNFEEYKNQTIEQQADAYAYATTREYLKLIKQYSKDVDFK